MNGRQLLMLLAPAAWTCMAQAPPPDLREAARLDAAGRCAESEAIYRRALGAGAPSAALLNNAGNHYLTCGDAASARGYFERVVAAQPGHGNANLQLARIAAAARDKARAARHLRALAGVGDGRLSGEAGAVAAAIGEYRLAQELFQRAAAAQPGDFDAMWNLGRAAARAGDLAAARQALEAASRLRPGEPLVELELGAAYAAAGDFPRAVFVLARAQAKAPEHAGIALALARAATGAGFHGDAVIAYDRFLGLRPGDAAAQRDRARSLAQVPGRRGEGLVGLREYVRGHDEDALGHLYLAHELWNSDAGASLRHLARALQLDPRLGSAHTARAWLLHRLGRDAEALPHVEAALRLAPRSARVHDQHGLVLQALDRPAEALEAFRRAAGLGPEDWEAALHLGRALMEGGREAEGREWLERYQKLRPARNREPRREAGMIELATLPEPDRRAREMERYRALAESRPDDPLLRLHLGVLLLADGRRGEAVAEFRRLAGSAASAETKLEAGRALFGARLYAEALPLLPLEAAPVEHCLAVLHTAGAEAALGALSAARPPAENALLRAILLDAAGRPGEALALLDGAGRDAAPDARVGERAALLLARARRYADAAALLRRAQQEDRGLRLLEAVMLGLAGKGPEAAERLRQLESRWPEWDAPLRLHALLSTGAAAARLVSAAGALRSSPAPACPALEDWLRAACRSDAP